jgi:hypothetical protein
MNKIILFVCLLFATTATFAQRTPTSEEKQTVNPLVDKAFEKWNLSWSVDKYVSRSAKISDISKDEDYGDISVTGEFSYKRVLQTYSGTFEATLALDDDGNLKVKKIVYKDHQGVRGSKTF